MIAQICILKCILGISYRKKVYCSQRQQRRQVLLLFHRMKEGITVYQSAVVQMHVPLSQTLILVPDESSHLLRLSSCLVRYV